MVGYDFENRNYFYKHKHGTYKVEFMSIKFSDRLETKFAVRRYKQILSTFFFKI